MSLQALSDYVVYSKYSHYLPEKKRRETWEEITDRVFGMHSVKYKKELEENKEFSDMFEAAKNAVKKKRVLGSQRALQFASPDPKFGILNKNEKIFNCTSTLVDRPRAFQEIGYVLLNGCGAGYSVQYHHIEKLPNIKKPTKGKKTYRPVDQIEGWSECWGILINSFFENGIYPEYEGYDVEFDLSDIRPAGALIAGQFKAPGPQPLEKSLSKIKALINSSIDNGQNKLSSLNVHDLICHIADAIISGGVRRSALICLFSLTDKEMRECKTGSWFVENLQRSRANNSVVLERGKVTKEQFDEIFENIKSHGEPGFYFVDDGAIHQSTNPCCQPVHAPILMRDGIKTMGDIKEGDEIWSESGWTKVVKKWSNGVKPVYKFTTDGYSESLCEYSYFVGTDDHKVVSGGKKIEIGKTPTVDFFNDDGPDGVTLEPVCIMNCNVKNVEFVGNEEVFDIMVDNPSHTYWTGGLNVSNCEIGFWPISEAGQSGFGFCNLCEINGLECKTKEEFFELCKHAAFIGTLQAGYNSTPYLGKATEDILRKEALLGVSITGWMDSPNILFNEENLKAGVELVKEINEKVARIIGINPAARTTCTKPSGTASSVLMTGSGIHAQHSRKFLRRAQVNKKEFAGKMMKRKNKCAVVESVYSTNKTDNVISFPCEVNSEAIVKVDLSAIGFLEKVKLAYQNWVLPGTYIDRGLNKAVTHNISVTVNVGDDEWDGARDYIFENRGYFSGISLLSRQGDLIYDQAPFAEILNPKELVERYGDAVPLASGLIVDGLHSFDNLWTACETALGTRKIDDKTDPIEPKKPRKSRGMKEKEYASALANYAIELNLYYQEKGEYEAIEHKKDWVRRAKQFAERYFDNDLIKTTFCLKHVSLWKDWLDIKREWKDIDWANIKENDQEYVDADTMAGASCSGGNCEILK